jgi:hypothetical protein
MSLLIYYYMPEVDIVYCSFYNNQLTKRIVSSKTVCFLCEILNKRLKVRENIKMCQGNHGNVREFKNCMSVATLIKNENVTGEGLVNHYQAVSAAFL